MIVNGLDFSFITPVIAKGLENLRRDLFGNGRLFCAVSNHGGLTSISYWARQHLGAVNFFQGNPESVWTKLFRFYANIGDESYYLTLNDTHLYPFGYTSHCVSKGIKLEHELLLLPDALVQRIRVVSKSDPTSVRIEMLHQESCTAVNGEGRKWTEFRFDSKLNALIASCTDHEPEGSLGDIGLAQLGGSLKSQSELKAKTWIGLGCSEMIKYHRGFHARSKHYLSSALTKSDAAAFFLVFADSRKELVQRLKELSKKVNQECNALLDGYAKRLALAPQIDTGNAILNSAFAQFPECMNAMKVPDRVGAIRATLAGYFVWGWDGLMAPFAFNFANEPESSASNLRFYQGALDKRIGIPHSFTSVFKPAFKSPFPSQAQFIAALYQYVAVTGDLSLAEELMPICKFILDRCRERIVKPTGLVSGNALWPDFPEAMEENGNDISSMNNSLLYQGLRSMEFLAAALGKRAIAGECRDWARQMRKSFVQYFYDEEKGFFISSCSSKNFKPRRHYCPQSIFWLTPFARELVAHAPKRIAEFMDQHLRVERCLLTLPRWDTAWMADGNQLGSSFPAADLLYLNLQKQLGNGAALETWTRDVEWFWTHHTAPEAFTPEAQNEIEMGVDNPGCKQLQTCSAWYAGFYAGLAGIDVDHEGITFTPAGHMPISIRGLRMRDKSVDIQIQGTGNHLGHFRLNNTELPVGSRKILWTQFKGKTFQIEIVRSDRPAGPTILRADGLRVEMLKSDAKRISATISGTMSGEAIVQAPVFATVYIDGHRAKPPYDKSMGSFSVPLEQPGQIHFQILT